MIKTIILVFIWTLLFTSCKDEIPPSNSVKTLNIDVNNIKILPKLSDIFEPVRSIALETNDSSMIQNIDKIEFFKNDIYVLDSYGAKGLLVFSEDGKFKYRIRHQGRGPGEYLELYDFNIENDEIRVLDYKKVLVYSLNGEFKQSIYLNFVAGKFANLSKNYDAYYGEAKEDRIIVANKTGEKMFSYFNYSPMNRLGTDFQIQKLYSTVLFNISLCDTIFKVTPEAVSPYCFIDFGKAKYTRELYEKLPQESKMNTYDVIYKSDKYAAKVFFSETRDFSLLSFVYKKQPLFCIASTKTNEKIMFNYINCNDDIWYSNTMALPVRTMPDNQVVFIQDSPHEFISGYKNLLQRSQSGKLADKEAEGLIRLNKICNNITESSNPVILIAKIKAF